MKTKKLSLEELHQVAELLQRDKENENYKAMWGRLKTQSIDAFKNNYNNMGALSNYTDMEIIEQKYFPK